MEDSLVSRRSKRSTAGNRMEAALAEMSIDDLMQDAEEDVDFVSKVEEEDLFESDFAETDEEMGDEDAGERALEDEERRARRAARAKVFKALKVPARKVTFDSPIEGEHTESSSSVVKVRPQRRVSLGQAIDVVTGEILDSTKRQSAREATRMNTEELRSRLKDAQSRKAVVHKRPKEIQRRRTQADLIATALDTEEENIKSHRDYLAVEEERRKKARIVKPTTLGPKLRWRSRIENVTVTVYEPAPISQPIYQSRPTWSSPFAQSSGVPAPTYTNSYAVTPPGQASSSTPHPPVPFPPVQYPYPYPPQSAALKSKSEASVSQAPSISTPLVASSNNAPPVVTAITSTTSTTAASPVELPAKPAPAKAPTCLTPTPSVPPALPTPSVPPALPTPLVPPALPTPSVPPALPAPAPSSVPPATPTTPATPTPYNGYYQYSYYTPQASATSQPPYQPFSPYYSYPPPAGQYASQPRPHLQLQPPQQVARKTTEKQAKNYAEIILNEDPKSKPEWREVMNVLFGRHADWDKLRVYYGKNRPTSRQIHTCPITGLQARYRDPRSGVPYANAGAFRILTRLLAHEYIWSPNGVNSGVFVGHEKQRGASGVPESWGEAMGGVGENWRGNVIQQKAKEKEKEKEREGDKERKEEKQKEKTKQKEKEIRVGGRRSSRIAGDTGIASSAKAPDPNAMDIDQPDKGQESMGQLVS